MDHGNCAGPKCDLDRAEYTRVKFMLYHLNSLLKDWHLAAEPFFCLLDFEFDVPQEDSAWFD